MTRFIDNCRRWFALGLVCLSSLMIALELERRSAE
jgi:hypothetical protein